MDMKPLPAAAALDARVDSQYPPPASARTTPAAFPAPLVVEQRHRGRKRRQTSRRSPTHRAFRSARAASSCDNRSHTPEAPAQIHRRLRIVGGRFRKRLLHNVLDFIGIVARTICIDGALTSSDAP